MAQSKSLQVRFVLIRDMTHFLIELMITFVIIRSNEGEFPDHEKCSTEGGYEQCKTTILIGLPVRERFPVCSYNTYDTAIILIGPPIILGSWGAFFLPFVAYNTRPSVKYYYWLANQSSVVGVCISIKVVTERAEVISNWSCHSLFPADAYAASIG